ncbi:hypothetical protein [Roseospira goensis]|uniref:Uncharacterized protein n=1 Tax=Roseospira goensis TaxID=391922 RepID=A0A7W6RZB2_9PROT|nr:hypothetical protein [Roseospira goensis]MBB4285384.1 hypothetical protein [Roseospira goensis]
MMLPFPLANPEFRRNLWVEFSAQRLATMPALLGLLLLGGHAAMGVEGVAGLATTALFVLLVLWGTRMAAGAIGDEIQAGTWDAQRMSALRPWTMTWGKLLGATAYSWYGAAFCVVALLATGRTGAAEILNMLLTGLTAQGAAFFAGLLLVRGAPRGTVRTNIALAQAVAIVLAIWLATRDWYWSSQTVRWWGLDLDGRAFMLSTQVLALAWVLAGVHAVMREELRYPSQPWTWLAFLAFAAAYTAGFSDALSVALWFEAMVAVPVVPLVVAFATAATLTLVAALAGPQSSVALRRWLAAPTRARGRPVALLLEAPAWSLGLAVTVALSVALTAVWLRVPSPDWLPVLVWSAVLFLIRDLGIVLALTLDGDMRRGPAGALIVLLTLYLLVPIALADVLPGIGAAVRPTWGATVSGTLVPALGQALVAWAVVGWRWRSVHAGAARTTPG